VRFGRECRPILEQLWQASDHQILDVVSRGERASGIPALRSAAAMRTGDLKNWLRGTHHGVDSKHLPAYLDEFAFCFNRRRSPMAAFQSLLGLTGVHPPTTRKMLYGVESSG
jgi:hypothetical protein